MVAWFALAAVAIVILLVLTVVLLVRLPGQANGAVPPPREASGTARARALAQRRRQLRGRKP